MGRPMKPLPIGGVFGKLTVVRTDGRDSKGQIRWLCRCECGNHVRRTIGHIRRTSVGSCGCAVLAIQQQNGRERSTHGHYTNEWAKVGGSPTYRSWQSMLARCYYASHIAYRKYGARGISVTKPWRDSFRSFLNDMGERPDGLTLDRIDNRFGYFASNCRWSTGKTQMANRRSINKYPAFMHPDLVSVDDPRVAEYQRCR